jgi:hypothetical protein
MATTLVAMPMTQAHVPSSIGQSWIARALFQRVGRAQKRVLAFKEFQRRVLADRLIGLCV